MAASDTPIAGEPPEALSVNRSEALTDGIYAVAESPMAQASPVSGT